jgi:hypothetical protein
MPLAPGDAVVSKRTTLRLGAHSGSRTEPLPSLRERDAREALSLSEGTENYSTPSLAAVDAHAPQARRSPDRR